MNQEFAYDLLNVGLELQPSKSKCYITEPLRDTEWDALQGNIPNGMLKTSDSEAVTHDSNALHVITEYNVPISKDGVVKGYLEQQKNRIIRGFDKIATMHDHGRWPHPEIPSWQMLWILTIV